MSSIVKGKAICEYPATSYFLKKADEQDREKARLPALENGRDEVQEKARMSEWIEKEDLLMHQAAIKCRHIEEEAESRANALLSNAKKASQMMLEEARTTGYEAGYCRGLEIGIQQAEKEAVEGLWEISQLAEACKTAQQEMMDQHEEDTIELAFVITEKILKQQVQRDKHLYIKLIEELVQEQEGTVKIFLSEYQKTLGLTMDKSLIKRVKELCGDIKLIILKEEDVIMAETAGGVVDMSISTQLEQLRQAVKQGR